MLTLRDERQANVRKPFGIGGGVVVIPFSSQGIAAFESLFDCFSDFRAVLNFSDPTVNDRKARKQVLYVDQVLMGNALTRMSPFAAMKVLTAPSISRVRSLTHAPSQIFFNAFPA